MWLLLGPVTGGHTGLEGLGNLSKVAQLSSMKIRSQACCLQGASCNTAQPPRNRSSPHWTQAGGTVDMLGCGAWNSSPGGQASVCPAWVQCTCPWLSLSCLQRDERQVAT